MLISRSEEQQYDTYIAWIKNSSGFDSKFGEHKSSNIGVLFKNSNSSCRTCLKNINPDSYMKNVSLYNILDSLR